MSHICRVKFLNYFFFNVKDSQADHVSWVEGGEALLSVHQRAEKSRLGGL